MFVIFLKKSCYLRGMKNILFIIGLLMGIMLFTPEKGMSGNDSHSSITQDEAIMKEMTAANMQHHFEVLSNELKDSSFLAPRRVLQTIHNISEIRVFKSVEKLLQHMRLKGEDQLYKVSRNTSIIQTINLSTLLCRMGHHVFALRKLII